MKKTYKSSLLALSVLASFTSCSESESLQQANLSKDKITFHATLDNSWKPLSPASSSRAAIAAATEKGPIVVSTPFGKPLYLHPVVQDGIHIWSKEGKPITRSGAPLEDVEHERVAQTRGIMSTKTDLSDYQSFGVTAIYKNGENNVSLFQEENGDPKIAVATSTNEDKVWEIKDSRWPVGSEVSFHAFAPYSAGSTSPLSFKPDVDGEKTQITYTALTGTEEIKAQPDLILATAKGSQSDNALGLNFSHALTAVTFAIDKDLADVLGAGKKLTSITLSGIPNEGTYNLAVMKGEGNAAPEWQLVQDGAGNNTGTYTFDLKDQDIVTGKDFALTSDNNTLMMIPQTLPETAKLNFQFELDGVLQSLTIDMKGQVWLPGKSVIYKLSASAINTLSNPEVVYPTTWTAVGYPKQSFNANEAIGLYAVSKDGLVVIPNIKLVKQQDDQGNSIWKTENNQRFLFTTNYKYFAYYPYSNTAPTIDKEATTADAFFKDMIAKWEPAKTQNDETALVSQDLQVASGVIEPDASKLKFEMAHSMGLAVLNRESKSVTKHYILSGYPTYTWDNGTTTLIPSDILSDSQKLYATTNTQGVKVIKPSVVSTFSSTSTGNEAWSGDVNITAAANGVGTGTATIKATKVDYTYTMEVGDIYYSDGAMTHQSEALASGKTPVGIVGYLGNDYWTEKGVSGKGGHALVMCLKTIGSTGSTVGAQDDYAKNRDNGSKVKAYIGTRYVWYSSNSDAGRTKINSKELIVKSNNQTYGSGYTETDALKGGSAAAAAAKNYMTLPANSTKCTGWFLPTAGQYYAVMTNLGAAFSDDWTGIYDGNISTHPNQAFFNNMTTVTTNINNKLKKVGDSNYTEFFGEVNTWSWTSSELSATDAVSIDSGVDDLKGPGSVHFYYSNNNKLTMRPVRPFLAF